MTQRNSNSKVSPYRSNWTPFVEVRYKPSLYGNRAITLELFATRVKTAMRHSKDVEP